jgi:hypothetical protein
MQHSIRPKPPKAAPSDTTSSSSIASNLNSTATHPTIHGATSYFPWRRIESLSCKDADRATIEITRLNGRRTLR